MVRIGSSGARDPAWKSMPCPMLASLTKVMVKTSPTLPCRVGPGAVPLKVHKIWRTPGATSTIVSLTVMVRRCSVAPGAGASVGSYGCQSGPGAVWKSMAGAGAVGPRHDDAHGHSCRPVPGDAAPAVDRSADGTHVDGRGLPRGEQRGLLTAVEDQVVAHRVGVRDLQDEPGAFGHLDHRRRDPHPGQC